jgi:hypothetical protein
MNEGHQKLEENIARIAQSLEVQTTNLLTHTKEDSKNFTAIHAKLDEILTVIDPLRDAMVFRKIGMRMLMNSTKVIGWILAIGALLAGIWKIFMFAVTQTK